MRCNLPATGPEVGTRSEAEVVEKLGGPCRGRTYGPLIKRSFLATATVQKSIKSFCFQGNHDGSTSPVIFMSREARTPVRTLFRTPAPHNNSKFKTGVGSHSAGAPIFERRQTFEIRPSSRYFLASFDLLWTRVHHCPASCNATEDHTAGRGNSATSTRYSLFEPEKDTIASQ